MLMLLEGPSKQEKVTRETNLQNQRYMLAIISYASSLEKEQKPYKVEWSN